MLLDSNLILFKFGLKQKVLTKVVGFTFFLPCIQQGLNSHLFTVRAGTLEIILEILNCRN